MQTMQFTPDRLPEIEKALRDAGLTVATICREAGVDQSLWTRWKKEGKGGTQPTYRNWVKVQAVLDRHLPKRGKAA